MGRANAQTSLLTSKIGATPSQQANFFLQAAVLTFAIIFKLKSSYLFPHYYYHLTIGYYRPQ